MNNSDYFNHAFRKEFLKNHNRKATDDLGGGCGCALLVLAFFLTFTFGFSAMIAFFKWSIIIGIIILVFHKPIIELLSELKPSKRADNHNKKGNLAYNNGNYDEAIEEYSKSIKISPNILLWYSNKANAEYAAGYFKSALDDFNMLRDEQPDNPRWYNEIGNVYFANNQFENSIKFYNVAINLNSRDPVFYSNRAIAKYKLNDYENALLDLEIASKLDPTNGNYLEYINTIKSQLK